MPKQACGKNLWRHYLALLARVAALLALVLLWTDTALAQGVDCGDLQATINELHPDGGTIVVGGACESPIKPILDDNGMVVGQGYVPITITGFTGTLTIEGDPIIGANFYQEVVACDADPSIRPSAVLRIEDSSDVHLIGPPILRLSFTRGEGVVIVDSDVRFEGGA